MSEENHRIWGAGVNSTQLKFIKNCTGPCVFQNAVWNGYTVQCLCSSLVFVLHFLMLILNLTLF